MTFGVCQWCGGPVEGETSTGYVDDFCSSKCHDESEDPDPLDDDE